MNNNYIRVTAPKKFARFIPGAFTTKEHAHWVFGFRTNNPETATWARNLVNLVSGVLGRLNAEFSVAKWADDWRFADIETIAAPDPMKGNVT